MWDRVVSMSNSFNKPYLTTNILRELDIIDLRIKTLPDSTKKEVAQIKSDELRTIIKAIDKEIRNDETRGSLYFNSRGLE